MGLTTVQKNKRKAAKEALALASEASKVEQAKKEAGASVELDIKHNAKLESLRAEKRSSVVAAESREDHNEAQTRGATETVEDLARIAKERGDKVLAEKKLQVKAEKKKERSIKSTSVALKKEANQRRIDAAKIEGRRADARAQRVPLLEIREENRDGRNPRALSEEQQEVENDCNQQLCSLNLIIQSPDGFPPEPEQDPLA